MKEAMEEVKNELGRDAVILHTKKYREGGFLGYHSKDVVEVTAAVEDAPERGQGKRAAKAQVMQEGTGLQAFPSFVPCVPCLYSRPIYSISTRQMAPRRGWI